jgi:hypothetical protein
LWNINIHVVPEQAFQRHGFWKETASWLALCKTNTKYCCGNYRLRQIKRRSTIMSQMTLLNGNQTMILIALEKWKNTDE